MLSTKDSSFAPISSGEGGSQVKVVVDYVVHDPMVVNDLVKGVMKVYSPDGTLLKTSSSPTPFPISGSHGSSTLATTLTDPRIESVTASIVFTNSIKTETISNELPVNVDLVRGVLSEEQQEKMPQVLSESASEEEIPSKPLSENKLSSMESAITPTTIEQDEQPAKPQQKARQEQITVATPEICDDDLDNDVDGKVTAKMKNAVAPPDHPFHHPDRRNQ